MKRFAGALVGTLALVATTLGTTSQAQAQYADPYYACDPYYDHCGDEGYYGGGYGYPYGYGYGYGYPYYDPYYYGYPAFGFTFGDGFRGRGFRGGIRGRNFGGFRGPGFRGGAAGGGFRGRGFAGGGFRGGAARGGFRGGGGGGGLRR